MMFQRQTTSNWRWNNVVLSALKFTVLNNVESTLSIWTLILTTFDNVKAMLLVSTSNFKTLINVETTFWLWPFEKGLKEQKKIFELKKKEKKNTPNSTSLDFYFKILLTLLPILKEIWRKIFANPWKFLRRNPALQELHSNRLP